MAEVSSQDLGQARGQPLDEPIDLAGVEQDLERLKQQLSEKSMTLVFESLPEKVMSLNELYQKYHTYTPDPLSLISHTSSQGATANYQVTALLSHVKLQVLEFVELVDSIKVWVYLQIPRVQDQKSMGSSVQEEIVEMLSSGKAAGLGALENMAKYHFTRAKLISKIFKYPTADDYRQTVSNLDDKQYRALLIMVLDIRNNYAIIYDYIVKNMDKFKQLSNSTLYWI